MKIKVTFQIKKYEIKIETPPKIIIYYIFMKILPNFKNFIILAANKNLIKLFVFTKDKRHYKKILSVHVNYYNKRAVKIYKNVYEQKKKNVYKNCQSS